MRRRRAAGPRSDQRGRREFAARPVVHLEGLARRPVGRAVEDRRCRLRAETEFVQVGGDRRHTRHGEVERRHPVTRLGDEGCEITADARVDVQPEPPLSREFTERRDRIDRAVGKTGRRADQHDRLGIDRMRHRRRRRRDSFRTTGMRRNSRSIRRAALVKAGCAE